MSADIGWTIEELIARYELEPELPDVFVEGAFDREVLSRVSEKLNTELTFYEIDSINVPVQTLLKYNLTEGNKQRVIALSRELDSLSQRAKLICKVDRDLDHWFGELDEFRYLRWSTYCDLESHYFTREIAHEIAVVAACVKLKSFDALYHSLEYILRQLYALRLAARQFQWDLKWVSLRKYLKGANGIATFSMSTYITALLTSNSKGKQTKVFSAEVARWMDATSGDTRHAMRGHDYTILLAWAISEFDGHKEFASETAVQRLFVLLAQDIPTLKEELTPP